MGWGQRRTYNPWGHVSKRERLYRQRQLKIDTAFGKILQAGDTAKELFYELQELGKLRYDRSPEAAKKWEEATRQLNILMNALNLTGIEDEVIYRALGE